MRTLPSLVLMSLICFHSQTAPSEPRHGWQCDSFQGQCIVLSPTTAFVMQPRSILRYVEFGGRHLTVQCR